MPSLKVIETAAEAMAPAAGEVAVAARSKLAEFGSSLFSHQCGEQLLSRRRFLRDASGSRELDAVPSESDWQERKAELAEAITRRIQTPRLTRQEYFEPVRLFPIEDRPLVKRLLEFSAGNATDAGLMRTMQSASAKLEEALQDPPHKAQLFAAGASSPGNMQAYLFRKSFLTGQTTSYFHDSAEKIGDTRQPIVIFDDLRRLSEADRAVLIDIPPYRRTVAVNLNSFERTPNFIDFAKGSPAVTAKLEGLLRETKDLLQREPDLERDQAIERVLYEGFDRAVFDFNRQWRIDKPPVVGLRSDPIEPSLAFQRAIRPRQVISFLEMRFKDSPDARIMAAELLAENVEFHTLGGLIPELKNLESAVRASARRRNLDPANDIFVTASEMNLGQGSSESFMTYLYKQATGLPEERIVTLKQLQELDGAGKLDNKRIIALDDAIYSGLQADLLLHQSLASYRDVAVATLSSFQDFARRAPRPDVVDDVWGAGVRELITLQTDIPLGSAPKNGGNPLFNRLTAQEQQLLETSIAPPDGDYTEISSLKVFPHMTSDTTVRWLRQFTKHFPINFEYLIRK